MTSIASESSPTTNAAYLRQADRTMLVVLGVCLAYSLALSPWHNTWLLSILVGGGTLFTLITLLPALQGSLLYRCLMAVAFMVMSALHIQQSHGVIEMHFSIFVLLALLIAYRDMAPILVATVTIAIHHFLFFAMQVNGLPIWVTEHASWNMIFIHAAYVVAEAGVLIYLARMAATDVAEGQAMAQASQKIVHDPNAINLSCRAPLDTPITRAFNDFVGQLETLVSDIQHKLVSLRTMGSKLNDKSQQVSSSAEQQANESEYMVQAMQEMGSATAEVARSAENAASAARNADVHAADGNKAMQHIKSEIGSLNNDIALTGEAVMGTVELAREIDHVVDVIKAVAEQTNLLALNAAIEAARAGDHGRGFAVVADEVRNLSQRTAQSTAEIQSIIERLQQASQSAHDAMRRSQDAVQRCLNAADTSATTLSGMEAEITNISRLNDMIAAASQEQSTVGDDVARHLHTVDDIARNNVTQAVDLASVSAELQILSKELDAQLKRFRVG
ncbi:MAG: methyl-accepting chemotaxis protein [Pseudomonadales bacterium]|nr:methyl-accepting chemotaxis protein [Pseudomonadales bacterium]